MRKKAFTLMELALIFFIMAILAILFYRTLKPDNIVFNKLYYSAYTQMQDAYREVLVFSRKQLDGTMENIYTDGVFDITKYPSIFSRIVNLIGTTSDFKLAPMRELSFISYSEVEACYNVFSDINNIIDEDFNATLTNNMRLRFDKIDDCKNCPHESKDGNELDTPILILTIDVNGTSLPNQINRDIIQFEVNKNGVLPIGDIETDTNLMQFNIASAFNGTDERNLPIQGPSQIIQTNLSYDVAACMANLPRHTYYTNPETNQSKNCGSINVIQPHCNQIFINSKNETVNKLKCTIEAVRF